MEQAVRNTVASILEAAWAVAPSERVGLLSSMDTIMNASGVTIKDVANYLREDKVPAPIIHQVNLAEGGEYRKKDGSIWKPSPTAEIPKEFATAGQACSAALDFVRDLKTKSLSPKEQDFMESLIQRLDAGRYEVAQAHQPPDSVHWFLTVHSQPLTRYSGARARLTLLCWMRVDLPAGAGHWQSKAPTAPALLGSGRPRRACRTRCLPAP